MNIKLKQPEMAATHTYTDEYISSLVKPTRVHRDVYTDPVIFELEMERIWGSAWIFIGHESQVKKPGEFYATNINHEVPVVMVRDKSGEIHVLHNRCGHKGVKLVSQCRGRTSAFRCPYHGWTFKHDGTLAAVPNMEGYDGTEFDKDDPQWGMMKVAQYDNYRGFVFATLDKDMPDLKTWLGGSAEVLDNLCDRAPEGEVEAAGGVLRFEHNCNWKMIVENLNDTMHPQLTHKSVVDSAIRYIKSLPDEAVREREEAEIIPPFGGSYKDFEKSGITGFKYGHHYDGGKTSIHADYSVYPEYLAAMEKAYGADRTREIFSFNTHNTMYYPSLTIKSAVQNIRVVRPVAVDKFIVETWSFRLKGAPDEMLQRTLLYSRLINAAGSMVGADDLEVYLRAQEGLLSNGSDWIEMHRQFGRDKDSGDRMTGGGTSDLDMRTQYGAWKEYMTRGLN